MTTFNARTLKDQWQLNELCASVEDFGLDIVGVHEHRRVLTGSGHQQQQLAGGLTWIVSSASAAGIGGVGMLLSARTSANVVRVKSVSERVLLVEFTAGQLGKLVVLSVYSPIQLRTGLRGAVFL